MAVYMLGGNQLKTKLTLKNSDSLCCKKCCALLLNGKLQCTCGETGMFTWFWDTTNLQNSNMVCEDKKEVLFHPVYSSGTAVVLGEEPFQKNFHYYFEIKILTYLYGTDVMIGVGKNDINQQDYTSRYCSLLGIDKNSWGYSYHGHIQHDKLVRKYGKEFGLGSLIGIHLDMYEGTLEYYLNRKPLGIAFKGLKEFELYPMVCSTAAQSSIRLSCSVKFEQSLQMKCLRKLIRDPNVMEYYQNIPGLTSAFGKELFWLIPDLEPIVDDLADQDALMQFDNLELEDEVVIPINTTKRCPFLLNKWGVYIEKEKLSSDKKEFYKTRVSKRRKCGCLSLTTRRRKNKINCNFLTNVESLRKALDVRRYHTAEEEKVPAPTEREEENVDIYSDLTEARSDERHCVKCNFKLGSHEECTNSPLCSFCDVII